MERSVLIFVATAVDIETSHNKRRHKQALNGNCSRDSSSNPGNDCYLPHCDPGYNYSKIIFFITKIM